MNTNDPNSSKQGSSKKLPSTKNASKTAVRDYSTSKPESSKQGLSEQSPSRLSQLEQHPPEKTDLNIGFMRLSDSAPLIIAQQQRFFERFGLQVKLCREVSWANIRDKVAIGALDAAQMLAPMPLLSTPGQHAKHSVFITGLMLSLNGNAITLSTGLCEQLNLAVDGSPYGRPEPILAAQRLRQLISTQSRQLTLATVYPHSMHSLQLRHWLKLGGICPDKDLKIIVLPPEQMVKNLAQGAIDGFCVGEPWNTAAIQAGIGSALVSGYQIWNNAPEKALVVTEHWHQQHPATHLRLRMAIMAASAWLSKPENRVTTAGILASKAFLDLPEHLIKPALLGNFQYSKQGKPVNNPDFIVFHRYLAGFPWRSRGECLLRQSYALQDRLVGDNKISALVKKVYRTDLYREAASLLDYRYPKQDSKPEASHGSAYTFEEGIELGADLILGV